MGTDMQACMKHKQFCHFSIFSSQNRNPNGGRFWFCSPPHGRLQSEREPQLPQPQPRSAGSSLSWKPALDFVFFLLFVGSLPCSTQDEACRWRLRSSSSLHSHFSPLFTPAPESLPLLRKHLKCEPRNLEWASWSTSLAPTSDLLILQV